MNLNFSLKSNREFVLNYKVFLHFDIIFVVEKYLYIFLLKYLDII